jgi:putative ABC transport system substrate-binding protein
MKWIVFICVGIFIGCFSSMAWADNGKSVSVTVVMSNDSAPYQQVLSGFKQELSEQGIRAEYFQAKLEGDLLPDDILSHNGIGGLRFFLAIGSRATDVVLDQTSGVPVISALALDAEKLDKADNATGVLMNHPIEVHFEYMKRFMPGVERVGVLFNPQENKQHVEKAQSIASELEIDLVTGRVEQPRDLPATLKVVSSTVQLIWSIADHTVFVPETAKHLLVYSFRNRVPLTGLSESWVKAGALYSLERDYFDVGVQCGGLAGKILAGASPGSLHPVSPRKVIYMLNLRTAHHMKLDLPPNTIAGASRVYE